MIAVFSLVCFSIWIMFSQRPLPAKCVCNSCYSLRDSAVGLQPIAIQAFVQVGTFTIFLKPLCAPAQARNTGFTPRGDEAAKSRCPRVQYGRRYRAHSLNFHGVKVKWCWNTEPASPFNARSRIQTLESVMEPLIPGKFLKADTQSFYRGPAIEPSDSVVCVCVKDRCWRRGKHNGVLWSAAF